ncbi:hypothetical protein [Mycolicibacterium sp. XJ870]
MQTIRWPFLAAEELDAGALTFRELRRFHAGIYPGVWAPRGVELSPQQRACAAWLWSRREGVIAGLSASATLGAKWIDAGTSAELIHTNRRPPPLIAVNADTLLPGETATISGLPVTTPARTAFDLGRRLGLEAGVQRIDALMNATDVDGGAESPYESLTRLLLVQAGFPRPETQIRVLEDYGCVVARIDMGWREYRVGVDFEGAHHWTDPKQRSKDAERFTRLPELGWMDFKLTSGMLHYEPQRFLDRVGEALISRGCPKTW